jgi:hypothetical protein
MTKKNWKTAGEIMAELNSNPDFVRRKAEKEKRREEREKRFAALERPILDELKASGFEAGSITELIKKSRPLPHEIVVVLLGGIETATDVKLLEWLVRALAAAGHPFDGRPLVKCYETFKDDNLRWVIANTIACAKPHSIDDWIDKALQNKTGKGTHVK